MAECFRVQGVGSRYTFLEGVDVLAHARNPPVDAPWEARLRGMLAGHLLAGMETVVLRVSV